jgi:hypothetical protein
LHSGIIAACGWQATGKWMTVNGSGRKCVSQKLLRIRTLISTYRYEGWWIRNDSHVINVVTGWGWGVVGGSIGRATTSNVDKLLNNRWVYVD